MRLAEEPIESIRRRAGSPAELAEHHRGALRALAEIEQRLNEPEE